MKNTKSKIITGLCFMFLFTLQVFSQDKTHAFDEANLTITFPATWHISEHGVHYLMPKDEDLSFQFEVIAAPDFDNALKVSEIELKAIFAKDPELTVNDIDINGMKGKVIEKAVGSRGALYYTIQTPENKYVRFFCIAPTEIISKYKDAMVKIVENLKPVN